MNAEITETGIPKEHRTWGMFCHLSSLVGFVIPFGNVIGPLVVWLMKREDMPFVDDQGKESLNFEITLIAGALVSFVLTFVVVGIFLMVALGIYWVIMTVIASTKASKGESYRYPYIWRPIK